MIKTEEEVGKKEKIVDFMKNHYITISTAMIVLSLVGFIQPVTMKFVIIIFLMNIIFFMLGKDLLEEGKRKLANKYFIASGVLFIYSILMVFIRNMSRALEGGKSLAPLAAMMLIGLTIGMVYFFTNKDNRENLEVFMNTPFAENLKILNSEETMKEGDIIICTEKDTNKPVIIPQSDRFLHQLVLGPTGCGKTSQILLPSILQDLKNPEFGVTVMEPKGDLAEKIHAMGELVDREVIYFNPAYPDCPYFNPMYGDETEVIENITTVYKMLAASDKPFFEDKGDNLLRQSLMVIKRLKGNYGTLIDLSTLVHDANGQGYAMIKEFQQLRPESAEEAKQNEDTAAWFLDEYFNENSKEFEHCSGIRSQVAKTVANKYLRRVLNPPNGENDLDFDRILRDGEVLSITTSQDKLGDMSSYLGYFLILNYQSAIFRRPGTEDTRRPHFWYIDEFQTYANPAFSRMLQQGRSYRVGTILATQARDQMAIGSGSSGEIFLKTVSANARNIVLFPGISGPDAEYYSKEFGEIEEVQESESVSREAFSLFPSGKADSVTKSERVEKVPRYSPSMLRYKPTKEITYSIISGGSLMAPGDGMVDYIPWDLHVTINDMVEEFREEQEEKARKLDMKDGGIEEMRKKISNNTPVKDPIIEMMNEDEKEIVDDFEYRDEFIKEEVNSHEDDII